MKKFIYLLSMGLCYAQGAYAYNLTTRLNTTQPTLGQMFYLTLVADENVSETPDLSALQNDFKVLSTSVSRRMSVINGQQAASTEWRIGLAPKKSGALSIPSVSVGNTRTQPVAIDVLATAPISATPSPTAQQSSAQGRTASATPYVIQGEIVDSRAKFYVQEEILYRVTLLDDGRLQSGAPAFEIEDPDSWIIRSFGEPEILTQNNADSPKRLITYTYALFPQKSGPLKIPAVEFQGTALGQNADSIFSPFGKGMMQIGFGLPSFGFSEPVRLYVPAKEVTILPVPESFKGSWWLPARDVRLTARWSEPEPSFKVGEARTREITLESIGSTESQLPEPDLPITADLKQYPQKPVRTENVVNGQLTATEKVNVVYIPQKSGEIIFPAVSVKWYNTQTAREEIAEIPALKAHVLPSENEIFSETPQPSRKASSGKEPKPQASINVTPSAVPSSPYAVWLWVVAAFVSGLCVSFALHGRLRRSSAEKPHCETRKYPDFIIQKARQKDFRSLRDALISWATGYFSNHRITNLKDVADAASEPQFSQQIDLLLACLYQAEQPTVWNAEDFIAAFRRVLRQKNRGGKKVQPLPPLYDSND